MKASVSYFVLVVCLPFFVLAKKLGAVSKDPPSTVKRYLYVAVPGIRDYLGYGGHGILVFDIDNKHRFVKRIATSGLHSDKTHSNVKGIAVSVPLNSVYVSTLEGFKE